jgi:DMSO reductase anchor subunit
MEHGSLWIAAAMVVWLLLVAGAVAGTVHLLRALRPKPPRARQTLVRRRRG